MKNYVLMISVACALFCSQSIFAQLGSGWVSYSPTKKIHLNGDGEGTTVQTFNWTTYQSVDTPKSADYTYDASTDTETFKIYDSRSNRSEIRLYNDYSTGSRQFEGYVTFNAPLDDESLMQVFGSTSGATQLMNRGYSANGGSITGGGKTLITNCYGVEVRLNVIHLQEDVGNKFLIYINGVKMTEFADNEPVTNYHKYGCYGTMRTGTATVKWRRARFFKDGVPPEGNVELSPVAPSGLISSAESENSIYLNWTDNSSNETSFQVERSVNQIDWEFLGTVGANQTFFSNIGLDASTTFYYRVLALNATGNSAYSNVTSSTTQNSTTPYKTTNIVLNKPVTVSNFYQNNESYNGSKALDGDFSTRWAVDNTLNNATLEVDLGGTYTFGQAVTREYSSRVSSYKIQYWNGTEWGDAFTGTTIGPNDKTDNFPSVTGSKVRLNILSCSAGGPTIYEFAVKGYESTSSGFNNPTKRTDVHLWYAAHPSTIGLHLQNPTSCKLSILDMQGNEVKLLVNGYEQAGTKTFHLNTSEFPNGVYFARLVTSENSKTVKLIVNNL
ncbi:MAG TPA: discoidin domain-containing protein [Bacteroidales bacterium]|nr:discoidin domain-containing protein [Bacteroidales bacterium]